MSFFEDLDYALTDDFDQEFKKGNVRKGTCELYDGYYTGFIERFGLMLASNNLPYIRNVIVIMEPEEFRGFRAIKYSKIDLDNKPKTVRRIKTDIFTLGFAWEGLRSLENEEKCAELVGLKVSFKITHRKAIDRQGNPKRYENIWLNRVLGRMTPQEMQKYK